jgi:hypothetical protein
MMKMKSGMRHVLIGVAIGVISIAFASCGGKKEKTPPVKKAPAPDIAGEWRSDIESTDRQIARSHYRISEAKDSIFIRLVSMISPPSDELVPDNMIFEAAGAWEGDQLRLRASSWVNGKDTCRFALRGAIDPEGRLLLFYPADLCGEKNLPFTRMLSRVEEENEK